MLTRRQFLLSTATLPLLQLSPGAAHALTAGVEYNDTNSAIETLDSKRVEVLELFWYGCPHCFNLEPDLSAWVKSSMPKNAYFRRVPAVFEQTPHWVPLAQAYYAAEVLGLTEKLHYDFFNAIHLSGQNLNSREVLLKLVQTLGVNRHKFEKVLDSEEVKKRIERSKAISAASGAKGVPSIVVDGKYQTSVSQTGSHARLLSTVNELISLAQQNKKR